MCKNLYLFLGIYGKVIFRYNQWNTNNWMGHLRIFSILQLIWTYNNSRRCKANGFAISVVQLMFSQIIVKLKNIIVMWLRGQETVFTRGAPPLVYTRTQARTHTTPRPSSRLFRYIVVYFIRRYAPTRGEPFDSVLTRVLWNDNYASMFALR